jgi:hypothetical protein
VQTDNRGDNGERYNNKGYNNRGYSKKGRPAVKVKTVYTILPGYVLTLKGLLKDEKMRVKVEHPKGYTHITNSGWILDSNNTYD